MSCDELCVVQPCSHVSPPVGQEQQTLEERGRSLAHLAERSESGANASIRLKHQHNCNVPLSQALLEGLWD